MTISAPATSKMLPAKNDWRVVAAGLTIIAVISALAGGWGFGALTGWHPVITGLVVLALYTWVYLGRPVVGGINNLKGELVGLASVTLAEAAVLVFAGIITSVIWILSLIPQYFLGWVFPFGPTLFVVWAVLSAILWLLDKVSPDPDRDSDFI